MADSMNFTPVTVRPEGLEHLAFSVLIPEGWQQITPPREEVDLDQPTTFWPLLVAMPPYAAIVLAVAARPAFSDGTVEQWANWLAGEHQLTVHKSELLKLRSHPAVRLDCTQQSDAGPMRAWCVFVEDGGRLYQVSTMAPEPLFAGMTAQFGQMLMSFGILDKRGPTAPRGTQDAIPAPAPADGFDHPRPDVQIPPMEDEDPHANPNPVTDTSERATQAADVALADDDSSLDAEHELNVRLRDGGAGLVPNVVMRASREKFATVAAGAIGQLFRVPFGWHVIDDGRRTLVFDAGGRMQINLDLRPAHAEDDDALLNAIHAGLYQDCPDLEHMRFEAAGMKCMSVRNLLIDGERLWQTYLIKDVGRSDLRLVCRVTGSTEDDMRFALNASEVMLTSMHAPPQATSPEPQWWVQAQRLEQEDRLKEAEQVLLKAIDHAGVCSQIAHLYELRMIRKKDQGDRAGALEAHKRSMDWMRTMASSATSGGEGTAYMLQVKQHEADLIRALGFDPKDL